MSLGRELGWAFESPYYLGRKKMFEPRLRKTIWCPPGRFFISFFFTWKPSGHQVAPRFIVNDNLLTTKSPHAGLQTMTWWPLHCLFFSLGDLMATM